MQYSWFKPRTTQMNYFLNSADGEVGRYFFKRAMAIQAAAKISAGVKTGALKKSIHIKYSRKVWGQDWTIGSPLKYAYVHHEGARPHVILPQKVGGKLAFMGRDSKGRTRLIVVDRVNHPGHRGRKFLSTWLFLALR